MAGQPKSGLMTELRRSRIPGFGFLLVFVCVYSLAEPKPAPSMAGMRVPAAGSKTRVNVESAEIQSEAGSRPPPSHSGQLLSRAADIVSPGEISQPIPLALAAAIGVVLILSFFLFTRERRL